MNFHRSSQILKAALIASVAAVAMPAAAQEASEIIVTAQRENRTQVSREGSVGVLGNQPAENVPFSVKSYNAALILNQQPQTLGQVLENDPSVRTTYGFGNAQEVFVIRGFTLASDDVGFDGLYGIVPRQLVAPELYESVQVLNGASAFLNGAAPGGGGLGGSVNLVPKRATADGLKRATLNYTSSEHFGGSLDVGQRFGDGAFGVRLNAVARRGDVAIDDEFRSTYLVGGAFDYSSGPLRMSLDVAYQRMHVRGLRPKLRFAGAIPAVPAPDTNYAQPWTYTTARDIFGIAKLEYDLADDVLFYASAGARDSSEHGIYGSIVLADAVTGAADYSSSYIPRTDNNESVQAGLRAKFGNDVVSSQANIGGSVNWLTNRNAYAFYTSSGTTNIYNPVVLPRSSTLSFPVGGNLDDPFPIERSRLASVFASNTLGFLDDRVLLTGGVRIQAIKSRSYSAFGGALTSTYDESELTPVAGLVIKPVEGLSLFANRIEGLQRGATAPNEATVINRGEVLAPFKSTQYEFGGKLNIGGIAASLAFYQTDKPSAYAIPDPEGSGLLRYGAYGKQRNRGIEVSLDGELTKDLYLIAGASVNEAKFRETLNGVNESNSVPGIPDYLVNAGLEWDTAFVPGLTLTGRVVHTGKQMADNANTLRLPEWTRVDLGARYVAVLGSQPVTFRFNVDNVANERYWASAFDAFSPQLLQGAPRTYKASLSVDF
ncbi:TonB-dependent receptor [Sphingobium sp. B11D3D]|uniref:TonB-dependent receptor n=1 Tax=Sphingobium sp. B11D3D TaxID=2940576 RepID=UPI002224AAAA|nr:TonB-dependent receptor [Sphingobium sp. B11D3D]MCW2368493.1 iron complex outermembrane receptor protein [Sphingobium sp. B11D3D]